jgi:hypothetical protein
MNTQNSPALRIGIADTATSSSQRSVPQLMREARSQPTPVTDQPLLLLLLPPLILTSTPLQHLNSLLHYSNIIMSAPLVILLLINGLTATEMTASLDKLKSQTKNIGTHARREFFYTGYTYINSQLTKTCGTSKIYSLVGYHCNEGEEGSLIADEFDDRQKKMIDPLKSTMTLMGGRKIKASADDDDDKGKPEYFIPFFDDDAQAAYDDLTSGEEVITLSTSSGVMIQTKNKKRLCRATVGSSNKGIKDLLEFVGGLKANDPLTAINWEGSHLPPVVNSYNVILTGAWPSGIVDKLPTTIGHCNSTSSDEIYEAFLARRNDFLLAKACALIDRHLVDVQKGTGNLIYTSSPKDAGTALRNALLKTVYVSESKKKFIDNVKLAGGVELNIIQEGGSGADAIKFNEYGGLVFELFFRTDLSVF